MRLNRTTRALILGLVFSTIGCGGDAPAAPPAVPMPAGEITGQALLFDGLDHAATTIVLRADGATTSAKGPVRTSLRFTATTNASGAFVLRGVPAGTYVATFHHETYAETARTNIVVGDPDIGGLDLGKIVLTRAAIIAGGREVVAGNKSPGVDRQLFVLDGQLDIYDHQSGALTPVPVPGVGGSFTPDGKFALIASGASPTTGATDALYVARLDGAPGAPMVPPVLVSANAVQAGASPDSSHGFVLTPNGNGTNVDLWTFAFADPTKLTQAATNLPASALSSIPDPAFPSTGAYTVPVYKQLAYDDNPQTVGGVSVRDFNLFDVSTGVITKLPQVESSTTLPLPAGSPTTAVATRLLRVLADPQARTRDLYLFTPGGAPPVKINVAPIAAGLSLDVSSAVGRAYVLAPDSNGGTSVSTFELTGAPSFRALVPSLLWTSTNLRTTLTSRGRRMASGAYLALVRSGANVDLVSIDLATGTVTSIQPSLTRLGGAAITSSDDLATTAVMRTLSAGKLSFNIGATATQLTPGVIDAEGAHLLTGTFDSSAFNTLTLSADGKGAVFIAGANAMGFAAIPGGGAATPTVLTLTATPSLVAISGNAAVVAYAAGNTVTTMAPDGSSPAAVLTTASAGFTKLFVDTQAVVAVDTVGQATVGKVGVAASGVNAVASASNATCHVFADGNRVLIHNGSSTLVEVDAAQATPVVANTYSASAANVVMNGARTRAFILGTGLTALRSDGTKETLTGSWTTVPVTAPGGKMVYFRDSTGRIVGYGETAAAVDVATNVAGVGADYLRTLNAGADIAFIDAVSGRYDLVTARADTGARTVVVSNLVASSPSFESAPSSTLRPWVSSDGNTVFGLGDTNAASDAKLPPNIRLAAFTTAVVAIGENVATTPPPALDASKANLVFQTNKESQFGTATIMSYPLGGTQAVVVAERVRTYAVSPDGGSVAAIVMKDGVLQLQSGPVGKATTAMGPLGYPTLSASNLVFSDDGQRLFTFDVSSTGSIATRGKLLTGTVGVAGLTAVTEHVLGVYPDKTGKHAAVLTRDVAANGRFLNRFIAP